MFVSGRGRLRVVGEVDAFSTALQQILFISFELLITVLYNRLVTCLLSKPCDDFASSHSVVFPSENPSLKTCVKKIPFPYPFTHQIFWTNPFSVPFFPLGLKIFRFPFRTRPPVLRPIRFPSFPSQYLLVRGCDGYGFRLRTSESDLN